MFPTALSDHLKRYGIVPVIVLNDVNSAVPLAKALVAGGLPTIEITFRTAAAEESIRRIRAEVPDMLVGAGTLITPTQVKTAIDAGSQFGVAPGTNPDIIKACQDGGLPFAPGVMTPSDIEKALSIGCKALKFFPAESAGGANHLKSIAAPYLHEGISFNPTGGIDAEKAQSYLKLPFVSAVGGSWLATAKMIDAGQWDAISAAVAEAVKMAASIRG